MVSLCQLGGLYYRFLVEFSIEPFLVISIARAFRPPNLVVWDTLPGEFGNIQSDDVRFARFFKNRGHDRQGFCGCLDRFLEFHPV